MSAEKSIRLGFLGVSHPHAGGRANVLTRIPELDLIGAFEPEAAHRESFASAQGVPVLDTTERFFDQLRPELVIIEGTNRFNAEMALEAAERGVPMLIEKPGAHNLATLRTVQAAVAKSGVFCQVGYHLRYAPSVEPALRLLADRRLGRLTTVRFHAAVMAPWLTDPWFCDAEDRGGLVYLDFCHMLDLLILMLGKPTAHRSRIRKLEGLPEHPFEDSAAFLLEFGEVLAAGDCCGWEANDWIESWRIELYGIDGTLEIGLHPPFTRLFRRQAVGELPAGFSGQSHPAFEGEENYARELRDITDCVLTGRPPRGATIDEALTVVEIMEEMYRQNEES